MERGSDGVRFWRGTALTGRVMGHDTHGKGLELKAMTAGYARTGHEGEEAEWATDTISELQRGTRGKRLDGA